MKFNSKFNLPPKYLAKPPSGKSRVQQHFKDEVDINFILAKYRKTGVVTHIARAKAIYGDFVNVPDFAEASDIVARATQQFDALPATLRNEFGNSIVKFQEYIGDSKNLDRCYELGIYERPAAPAGPDPLLETLREVAVNTKSKKRAEPE